ncbi:MAG TPA: hypothetical protein VLJ17_23830, partial [Xanthobacteraceae bacterium]|nr:hypothetical protein [Xanthobacteraceae bacterium]
NDRDARDVGHVRFALAAVVSEAGLAAVSITHTIAAAARVSYRPRHLLISNYRQCWQGKIGANNRVVKL